jgi:hypothetical protein
MTMMDDDDKTTTMNDDDSNECSVLDILGHRVRKAGEDSPTPIKRLKRLLIL